MLTPKSCRPRLTLTESKARTLDRRPAGEPRYEGAGRIRILNYMNDISSYVKLLLYSGEREMGIVRMVSGVAGSSNFRTRGRMNGHELTVQC